MQFCRKRSGRDAAPLPPAQLRGGLSPTAANCAVRTDVTRALTAPRGQALSIACCCVSLLFPATAPLEERAFPAPPLPVHDAPSRPPPGGPRRGSLCKRPHELTPQRRAAAGTAVAPGVGGCSVSLGPGTALRPAWMSLGRCSHRHAGRARDAEDAAGIQARQRGGTTPTAKAEEGGVRVWPAEPQQTEA